MEVAVIQSVVSRKITELLEGIFAAHGLPLSLNSFQTDPVNINHP